MPQTILNNYSQFVEQLTSRPSNELSQMNERIDELTTRQKDVNMSLLITGGLGLSSETGELNEILKKCLFQGKPMTDETIFHMKRELGDILFYWCNTVRALNLDPNAVMEENIHKLKARYPRGEFDVYASENRSKNDL
jgi:NTP pyrophosphatase (non-canonical NTP hydrolase)|tara:strand:+ start:58 stop:471 length:414 start_codon:yes stop_codon:yes gene_type:complete